MQKAVLSFIALLALSLGLAAASAPGAAATPTLGQVLVDDFQGSAASAAGAAAAGNPDEQMLREQKHFVECLAYVYNPGLWISYGNSLFFMPRNDGQRRQIETMKAARAHYAAFTNRETRHEFVAKLIAQSGLAADWQNKILLPYSTTNQYLTPTLDRPLQIVDRYTLLKSFPEPGDVLIQAGAPIYFVMGFGRGADDAYRTNALLIKEGLKTYTTESNKRRTVEAFSDAALSSAETAALNKAVAAFQKKAAALGQETAKIKARQDFEDCRAKATEASPFMEYLLAKAYLEGRGTDQDEKLGLLWMNKAAKDGSGDARTYLDGLKTRSQ